MSAKDAVIGTPNLTAATVKVSDFDSVSRPVVISRAMVLAYGGGAALGHQRFLHTGDVSPILPRPAVTLWTLGS